MSSLTARLRRIVTSLLVLLAGVALFALVVLVGATLGGISALVPALIIGVGLSFLGFVSVGTGKAIVIWVIGFGAVSGSLKTIAALIGEE